MKSLFQAIFFLRCFCIGVSEYLDIYCRKDHIGECLGQNILTRPNLRTGTRTTSLGMPKGDDILPPALEPADVAYAGRQVKDNTRTA